MKMEQGASGNRHLWGSPEARPTGVSSMTCDRGHLRHEPHQYFRRNSSDRQSSSNNGRGSMRKVLPALPDMDTQMSLSAKMIDRRTSTPKGNHSYGPFFLEYSLLAEYNLVRKQKLPGVYVIPSTHSPLQWYGVIFVRSGVYQEGIFRFKIIIPENYPDGDCPRLYFDHAVFHPLVSPCAPYEMDLRRGPLSKKWRRNVNHIWQILHLLRKNFYKVDTTNPLNTHAARLYEASIEDPSACGSGGAGSKSLSLSLDGSNVNRSSSMSTFEESSGRFHRSMMTPVTSVGGGIPGSDPTSVISDEFYIEVRRCVGEWKDRLYEPPSTDDPHFLAFQQYEPKVHEPVRIAMVEDARRLQQESENCDQTSSTNNRNCHSLGGGSAGGGSNYSSMGSSVGGTPGLTRGHSFLQPGSLEIFSRQSSATANRQTGFRLHHSTSQQHYSSFSPLV